MTRRRIAPPALPEHWTDEQALAVFEFLQALRENLWTLYGPAVQQAWRQRLHPETDLPEFDPDQPF
jgi:hypothetical protein